MSEKTLVKDLTQGKPMRQLLAFSLPFMLSNLLQQAYSMADTIVVGRYLGSAGLAAVSNASYINFLFLMFCMGVASAGQIIISQHIGAGNRNRLQNTIGTLLVLEIILGVIFAVTPFFTAEGLMTIMNVPPEAWDGARDYLYVCAIGNFAMALYNAMGAILRGMGDSKHPTIFVIISSVLNVGLDILFVGPMNMGCYGAALATTISQFVSTIVSFWFAYTHRDSFGFDFKLSSFRIDRTEIKPLIKLGIPMMIQSMAITISMMFITARINVYGLTAAAVTSVGNKINMVANICCGALNTAGSTIVGQNFAAGKHERVTITLGCILLLGTIFAGVVSLIVALFPEGIFRIFADEPEVLALCHSYVIISVLDLFGFATRATAFAFINGIGFSMLAFAGGLLDGVLFRIGLALLFELTMGMGLKGLWLGNVLAGFVFFFVGGAYFLSGKWKTRKSLVA